MASQHDIILELDSWLAEIGSPLHGYADYTAILSRQWGCVITLPLAVGQAETGCGTNPASDQTMVAGHNVWGYGKSSQPHGYLFPDWPNGIASVTEKLAKFVHGQQADYPICDTIEKLGSVWVYGDKTFQRIPENWVAAAAQVIARYGGNPEALSRSPLARAI